MLAFNVTAFFTVIPWVPLLLHFFILVYFAFFSSFPPKPPPSPPPASSRKNISAPIQRAIFRRRAWKLRTYRRNAFSSSCRAVVTTILIVSMWLLSSQPYDPFLTFLRTGATLAIFTLPTASLSLFFQVFGGYFLLLAFNIFLSLVFALLRYILQSLRRLPTYLRGILYTLYAFLQLFLRFSFFTKSPHSLSHRRRRLLQRNALRLAARRAPSELRCFVNFCLQHNPSYASDLVDFQKLQLFSRHLHKSWRTLSATYGQDCAFLLLLYDHASLKEADPWLFYFIRDARDRSHPRKCQRARRILRSYFKPPFYKALLSPSSFSLTFLRPSPLLGGGAVDSESSLSNVQQFLTTSDKDLHDLVSRLAGNGLALGESLGFSNCLFHTLIQISQRIQPPPDLLCAITSSSASSYVISCGRGHLLTLTLLRASTNTLGTTTRNPLTNISPACVHQASPRTTPSFWLSPICTTFASTSTPPQPALLLSSPLRTPLLLLRTFT